MPTVLRSSKDSKLILTFLVGGGAVFNSAIPPNRLSTRRLKVASRYACLFGCLGAVVFRLVRGGRRGTTTLANYASILSRFPLWLVRCSRAGAGARLAALQAVRLSSGRVQTNSLRVKNHSAAGTGTRAAGTCPAPGLLVWSRCC
jgi:hypothetical protein